LLGKIELAIRKTFRLRKDCPKTGRLRKNGGEEKRGEERRRRYRPDSQISNSEGLKVELRLRERIWRSDPFQIIKTGAATGGCSGWNRKVLKSDYQGRHQRTTFSMRKLFSDTLGVFKICVSKNGVMIY
jgi:hypothetical protein